MAFFAVTLFSQNFASASFSIAFPAGDFAVAEQIMHIRLATNLDRDDIVKAYLRTFHEDEKDIVSQLAIDLLFENTTPKTISLVAKTNNSIVGHVAFSPVKIDNDGNFLGYILAPLGVIPEYQKQGIGSKLVESGIQALLKMRVNILFVYGDPNYYGRFGFNTENAEEFIPQYKLQYPLGWQAIILNEFSVESISGNLVCVASLSDPKLW